MLIETVDNYKMLVDELGTLINISGYRNDYIAKKMGLRQQNFSAKKQHAKWTVNEVKKVLSIIENEDVEDYFLGLMMKSVDKNETLTLNELKKGMGWK